MVEINLLTRLPRSRRNIAGRAAAKAPEVIAKSKEFGFEYFDGPRDYGYGGYRYDGRWIPVAQDIISHYGIKPGDRILDVGCAKGFLVKDLIGVCPGLEVWGLDISHYALTHAEPEAKGRLVRGTCAALPFADHSFDLVIALDVIHNLDRAGAVRALREIERVGRGRAYVKVDSYKTPEQRAVFLDWVLTAEFHDYPEGWLQVFAEAGYRGDWMWTIIEA
jgi:ubiquinone/menaquinone biosynthesis C-methylase UbiE